ncbi:MAG: FeoB-associated Cys-rich membrane protein [Eubacteriales bacterium]|nr:FeoB-associated Cys-rich membrane protein [Eubacteriales bacterium]
MFIWIAANISTIIISAALIVIIAMIAAFMIKSKRKGKSSCGCGCSSCAMNGSCRQKM